MVDRVTFYRPPTRTKADKGEAASGADVAVASAIPCRVGSSQQNSSEGETAGQVKGKMRVDLFVPYDTTRPANGWYAVVTTQGDRRLEITGSVLVSDNLALKIECLESR